MRCAQTCSRWLAVAIAALALAPARAAQPAAAAGSVRIAVTGEAGQALAGSAYVALVAEESPWRTPLDEGVLPAGQAAQGSPVWSVAAGSYRTVCASPSHEVRFGPVFQVAAGELHLERCALRSYVAISGHVQRAVGEQPVVGAIVGLPHAFLADYGRKLSPLGERFTGPDRSTVTDAQGRFQLLGLAGFKSAVWIEGEGLAPLYLPGVLFGPQASDLGVLRLAPGAALSAAIAAPPGFAAQSFLVTLRPSALGSDPQAMERGQLAQRIWQRPVDLAGPIRWGSLPPGSYSILLRNTGWDQGEGGLVELSALSLQAGDSKSVRLLIAPGAGLVAPPSTSDAQSPAPGDLRVLITTAPAAHQALSVHRWERQKEEIVPLHWREVSGGRLGILQGGCRSGAVYVVGTESQMAAAIDVQNEDCAQPVRRALSSSAQLAGRVEAPRGTPAPGAASLRAWLCGARPRPVGDALGAYPFHVAKDGRWSVQVPAGCLQAALETAEFAPVRFNDLKVPAAQRVELGTQRLQFGAALLTRVIDDRNGQPVSGAAATLIRESDLAQAVSATYAGRGVPVAAEGRSGPGGWLHLAGLPEGSYRLRVRPPSGLAVFSDGFDLRPRLEAQLGDLHLPVPAQLDVTVHAAPELAAAVGAFQVLAKALAPPDWLAGASVKATAAKSGAAHFPQLLPGRWQLRVMAVGSRFTGQLGESEIVDLAPGAAAARELNLDAQVFHGRLTYLGEPIAAAIDLRPQVRSAGGPVSCHSGSDGEFVAVLEKPGRYMARITSLRGALQATVPAVDFADPDQEVELQMPSAWIEGLVVDGDRKPLAGASVDAVQQIAAQPTDDDSGAASQAASDSARGGADGAFRFDALAGGEWTLTARLDGKTSDPVRVSLADGERHGGVELQIRDHDKVAGHVLAPDGSPVPNATVWVTYPATADAPGRGAILVSGTDGGIAVDALVPKDTAINLSVQAAGLPVGTFRRPLADGGLELQLAPVSSRVDLVLEQGRWTDLPSGLLILVAADGSFASFAQSGVQYGSATRATIPNLPPGSWAVARIDVPGSDEAAAGGLGLSLPALARFEVEGDAAKQVAIPKLHP